MVFGLFHQTFLLSTLNISVSLNKIVQAAVTLYLRIPWDKEKTN